MQQEYVDIAMHLGSAWIVGSLVGLERTIRGRPAGFRTHGLVCLASALLMVAATYQMRWIGDHFWMESIRTDPTRMAQGIMTGIGFLGAGVIFKEGLSVRGLTTAASIWMTSALGILYGVGFYYPAILASLATLGTLTAFLWMEGKVPVQYYLDNVVSFPKEKVLPERELVAILQELSFVPVDISYRLRDGGMVFEYHMTLRSYSRDQAGRLAEQLRVLENVVEFTISPKD